MYYRISKNEKNLFFGKKIAQVWAVTLTALSDIFLTFGGYAPDCSLNDLSLFFILKNHF